MTTSEDSSSFLLPVISVIAVSYNHERYVIEALESIASQSVSEIELIFCDDASSDRSVEIATAWLSQSRLSYRTILHQTNQGLCRTLNEARLLCRGEFLQYVSCDDRLHPTKFERQLQAFSQSADSVAVICSDANLIDDSGSPMPPFLFTRRFATPDISSQSGLYKQLVRGEPCIAAPSALIRKSALDEIGWYDENLSTEDYDTWLRLLRKYDIIVLSDPLVDYRIHKHNFHTYLDKNNQWRHVRYQILKKHLDDPYVRSIFRNDLAQAVCDNQLTSVSLDDLVACQFDLQEVADRVDAMKNSKTYWACTRVAESYRYLRRMLRRR